MSKPRGLSVDVEIVGVRETLAALAELDPKLRRQTLAEMRKAAGPMTAAISAAIPSSPPLSGMSRGRLSWSASSRKATAKTGGRKSRELNSWPLLSVRVGDGAASMADMAGRGSRGHSPSGARMIGALTSRYGAASRFAWPAAERTQGEVTKAVRDACDKAAADVNVKLDRRPMRT